MNSTNQSSENKATESGERRLRSSVSQRSASVDVTKMFKARDASDLIGLSDALSAPRPPMILLSQNFSFSTTNAVGGMDESTSSLNNKNLHFADTVDIKVWVKDFVNWKVTSHILEVQSTQSCI